jgi:ElaB/YqjD/DUF883 family membrane-anchored ribosome-binding protein
MRNDLKELADAIVAASRQRSRDAAQRAEQQWERAQDYSVRSKRRIERRIGDRPWTSVGLAFSAGMFLGVLLRR